MLGATVPLPSFTGFTDLTGRCLVGGGGELWPSCVCSIAALDWIVLLGLSNGLGALASGGLNARLGDELLDLLDCEKVVVASVWKGGVITGSLNVIKSCETGCSFADLLPSNPARILARDLMLCDGDASGRVRGLTSEEGGATELGRGYM